MQYLKVLRALQPGQELPCTLNPAVQVKDVFRTVDLAGVEQIAKFSFEQFSRVRLIFKILPAATV